jgi:two-component system, OmpR family, KDP operon response regulator KdpE
MLGDVGPSIRPTWTNAESPPMTESRPLVLVVDDEPQMRRFIRATLDSHEYRPLEATTSAEALELAKSHHPQLVLLDLELPDGDGIEVMRRIRAWSQVPVIVISARIQDDDKATALDAGANDYLTKPFGINELLERMRVALRYTKTTVAAGGVSVMAFGTLRIDLIRRAVTQGGEEVRVTPIEYKLLVLLAQNAGRILTHRQILNEISGPGHAEQAHYVRIHMAELRKKIEVNPARPKLLMTESGIGYRLRDRAAEES